VASLIPALRQISPTAVPSSPCRRMKAICASVNFDLFMVLPRPTARIAHAAKLEFSSKDRSENREAGHESEQRWWNFEAECAGDCQVDDAVELCRLHYRQVGGLFPLQDATHIDSKLTVGF